MSFTVWHQPYFVKNWISFQCVDIKICLTCYEIVICQYKILSQAFSHVKTTWRAELINKSDLGEIFSDTNDTWELGLRWMSSHPSAQILCCRSMPLGLSPPVGICVHVWATLTNSTPELKPAELEWLGHWDLLCYQAVICKRGATRCEGITSCTAPEPGEAAVGVRANLSPKVIGWAFLLAESPRIWNHLWSMACCSQYSDEVRLSHTSAEEAVACTTGVNPCLRLISRSTQWNCEAQHPFALGKRNYCGASVHLLRSVQLPPCSGF